MGVAESRYDSLGDWETGGLGDWGTGGLGDLWVSRTANHTSIQQRRYFNDMEH
jgi:hypothetical protein